MGESLYPRKEVALVGRFCRAVLLDADHKLIGYLESHAQRKGRAGIGDDFVQGVERLLTVPTRVAWAGQDETLYDTAAAVAPLIAPHNGYIGRYILNHDRCAYVDKATVLQSDDRSRIHPLPVLTAIGSSHLYKRPTSGDTALIGVWARDRISMSGTVPSGFESLNYDLVAN